MPVGTNGCHQGAESQATACPDRRYPQGDLAIPGPARAIPDAFATRDQSAGQAATGTGAVRSRDCLDAPGDSSSE